jgi:hypothetical protein
MPGIPIKDLKKAGAKLTPELKKALAAEERQQVEALALKLLGVLADAPSQDVRRKALEKARRMISKR